MRGYLNNQEVARGLTHGELVLLPQNNGFVRVFFLEAHLVNNGKFW
jgi:hypothetical protein